MLTLLHSPQMGNFDKNINNKKIPFIFHDTPTISTEHLHAILSLFCASMAVYLIP